MTEKKPTNNDITKALDICSKSTNGCSHNKYTCEDCYLNGQPMCSSVLLQDSIDLHTSQQAEIERLNEYNENLKAANTALANEILDIKSKAVKEFAEMVDKAFIGVIKCNYGYIHHRIRRVLKEMVGEK